MPANLTPQYKKAEEEYRRAQTPEEEVACLEKMLREIPKHKGTDHLQADLKTRLKQARAEVEAAKSAPKKGKSYKFPRQGAGRAVLLGGPNSGKSRIVAELTNAKPEVADYPFTTREPAPAMMPWEDVKVQLIDTPPITSEHCESYLTAMVRTSDIALLCMNGASDDGPEDTQAVIEQLASRKTVLATETGFDEENMAIVRIKTLLVVTHADDPDLASRKEFFDELVPNQFEVQLVELDRRDSAEALRNRIFEFLNVIRVYTKAPGKPADWKDPFCLPCDGTVADLAALVHKDLAESLKYAKVWGPGVHDGQTVGPDHVLADKCLVELHA